MQDYDWNYNQPVDGDEKVFMCLVYNGLGRLAQTAGGTPSKTHKWMVSNLLSPYSSTLAMHAQSDSRCGKLIVSGYKNAEDNKATEQKTEQTAPASSPGLVHHPKMELEAILFHVFLNSRPTAIQAPLDLLLSTLLLPRSGGSGLAARAPRLLTTAVDV